MASHLGKKCKCHRVLRLQIHLPTRARTDRRFCGRPGATVDSVDESAKRGHCLGMPAANQGLGWAPVTRMRSTGLSQSAGGAGLSTSVIRKSPSGSSGTPAGFVLCWVKGAFSSQISVAKTLRLAVKPIGSPPASSRPRPATRIFPLVFTVAFRAEITQGKRGGGTPRTIFRFTVLAVGPAPTALATGMTPIPPSNVTRVRTCARADSGNSAVRNAKRTKAFFIVFVSSSSVALFMTNGTGSTAILRRNFARKKAPDEQATPTRANIFVQAPHYRDG